MEMSSGLLYGTAEILGDIALWLSWLGCYLKSGIGCIQLASSISSELREIGVVSVRVAALAVS